MPHTPSHTYRFPSPEEGPFIDLAAHIADWPIDTLLEKHELYLRWGELLTTPERVSLFQTQGVAVLLPLRPATLATYTVVNAAIAPLAGLLTLFLGRTAAHGGQLEWGDGALIVARRLPEATLYVTVVWHDWFVQTSPWVAAAISPVPSI